MSEPADHTVQQLQEAQKLFRQKQFQAAIAAFQKILDSDPNHLKALRGLAASYAQSGQIDQAIVTYQKLTTADLTSGVAWLNMGAIYNSQERYQEAAKAIRTGLIKEKKSALGYYYLGQSHVGLKQNSMAMTAFKEAIKIDSDMLDAHLALGHLYSEMKSHAQAIRHFEQAAKSHPESQAAQQALRAARQEKEQERDAANPFGRLVDMNNMGLKSNVVMNRELSEDEKLHDRHMVRTLARDLLVETENCLNEIRHGLEPALLSISRTLAEGGISPSNVSSSIRTLQDAIQSLNSTRQEMRGKVMLIRGHEEVVNTPEFGGQLGTSPAATDGANSEDDQ